MDGHYTLSIDTDMATIIVLSVSMTGVGLPITSPCPAEGGTMHQCAPLLHGLSLLGRHCSLSSADTCDQLLLEVFNWYVDNMDIQNIQACLVSAMILKTLAINEDLCGNLKQLFVRVS